MHSLASPPRSPLAPALALPPHHHHSNTFSSTPSSPKGTTSTSTTTSTGGSMPTPPPSAGAIAPPPFSSFNGNGNDNGNGNGNGPPVLSPALLGSRLRRPSNPSYDDNPKQHDDDLAADTSSMPPLPRALPPAIGPSPSTSAPLLPNGNANATPTSPRNRMHAAVANPRQQRIPTVSVPVSVAPINIATLPTPTPSSPADSFPSPTSPLRIPPRTQSRAPAPSSAHAMTETNASDEPHSTPHPTSAPVLVSSSPSTTCPHDSFLCPSATGSPLCQQCQAPVTRLKAMHAAFLDMRDERDELASRLATREAQLARIEHEAARTRERADTLEDQADEYLDRALQAESHVAALEMRVRDLLARVDAEQARADQLAREKAGVENELEDLSQQLFEQANSMVSDEARRHDQAMREMRARVEAAEATARDERQQSQELKRMVEELEQARERDEGKVKELEALHQRLAPPMPGTASSHRGSWASNYSGHYTSSNRSSFVHSSASPALAASPPPEVDLDSIDSYALEDFLDFMSSAPSVPLTKCQSLPFLQRALQTDLHPCLAFSAPKAPSAETLVAAMLQGELEVDTHSQSKPPASPRLRQGSNDSAIHDEPAAPVAQGGFFSFMTRSSPAASASAPPTPTTSAGPTKCTLCANHSSMPFVLRLPASSSSATHEFPMCAFCRDRVVAATDFVAFARNLRAGLFTRQSLGKVWADSLALRSRLGYARLGSLAAVDGPQTVGVGLAVAASAVANGSPRDE